MLLRRREDAAMDRDTNERWLVLCEQAAVEQDPARLLTLVTEINGVLEENRSGSDKRANALRFDS